MSRRYAKLSDHWLFISFIIFAALLCHSQWGGSPFRANLFPLAVLFIIYLGYKGGRWLGLVAGLASGLPVFFYSITYGPCSLGQSLLWSARPFEVVEDAGRVAGFSLEAVFFTGLLGYLTGVLVDRLESYLASHGTSLDTLIPPVPPSPYIDRLGQLMGKYWTGTWRKAVEEMTAEEREKEESDVEVSLTYDIDSKKKSLSITARRLGIIAKKSFIFTQTVVVAGILALGVTFFIPPPLRSVSISLHPIPFMAAAVFIIYFAFQSGGRAPITLVWFVAIASLSTYFKLYEVNMSITETLKLSPMLASPAAIGGMLIMTWWAARLGEIFRDSERRTLMSEIFSGSGNGSDKALPNDTVIFILLLLMVGCSVSLPGFYLSYKPYLALFVAIGLLAQNLNGKSLSNRVFVITGICALVSLSYSFANFKMYLAGQDMLTVFAFAGFALFASGLDLGRKEICRAACYGFFIALILITILSGTSWYPFTLYLAVKEKDVQSGRHVSLAVNLLLQIGLLEIAWRVMHGLAGRMKAERPGPQPAG